MVVHQLVQNFVPDDAVSEAVLTYQQLLRRLGHCGEIYANEVHPDFRSWVSPASKLNVEPNDWVIYHHAFPSPLSGKVLHLRAQKGIVFHDVAPPPYCQGTALHEAALSGRAQLQALASHVELAFCASAFGAQELKEAGFAKICPVPPFVERQRFESTQVDRAFLRQLRSEKLTLLTASQNLPYERFEDTLALFREVQRLDPDARLLVMGSPQGRKAGGHVTFLGPLDHAQKVAAYRASSLWVSLGEHDVSAQPLLEAMAADLPILAFSAGSVPEVLGEAGVSFTEKRFAALAELARELGSHQALRKQIIEGQRKRLDALTADRAQEALAAAFPPAPAKKRRKNKKKHSVAFVVQRFGEVVGGAEAHARQVAEKLKAHWDITVLSTTAKDHLTWENEFAPGPSMSGGLKILRFSVDHPRQMQRFNALSRQRFGRSQDLLHEVDWAAKQGPWAPGLWRHISEEGHTYDGFVAFTYLYASTLWSAPLVANRTLLVPTAHDEPPLQFEIYRELFERSAALLCNTPEEVSLIARRFPCHAKARVVGVGVDAPIGNPDRFRARFGQTQPYLFYLGRMEEGKGIPDLLRYYRALRSSYRDAPELVLAGGGTLKPSGDGVRFLGRISDQEKWDGLAGALAVVVPSKWESMSILALEGFSQGTPLLANAESEVLAGQCNRSGAGFVFRDAASFVEGVRQTGLERNKHATRARAYAKKHRWENVVAAYVDEMDKILEARR